MKHGTDLGVNRTGTGVSPNQSARMVEGAEQSMPTSSGDEHALASIREEYLSESPPVGSVPPPSTLLGVARSGIEMIRGRKPSVFLDKLGERIAFERSGTRLYEALITKYDASGSWEGGPTREDLVRFHDQELRHFEVVREAILSLGADPTVVTPSADIIGVATLGVLQVVNDPRTSLAESLQVLLVAELADHDGWEMLVRLADAVGQNELATRFRSALQEESLHLGSVRRWLLLALEREAQGTLQERPPIH